MKNNHLDDLMYLSGLTAQGSWDAMDSYDRECVQRFAKLIIDKCLDQCYYNGMNDELYEGQLRAAYYIRDYFGVDDGV
jgi:hypothetical protein